MLLTCNVIIQQRFSKRRGFASAIAAIGFSAGNFVGAPLTQHMIDCYGLRGTLALLGAIQSHQIPLALQFRSPKQFKKASNQTEVSCCKIIALITSFKLLYSKIVETGLLVCARSADV